MDGYRWFQYGTKTIPRSEPVIRKLHFCCVIPTGHNKGFRRQALFLLHDKQPQKAVLLHYLGDESVAVDYPHGNCKGDSNQVFRCTCPSVLADLSSTHDLPSNVYKSAISKPMEDCPPALQATYMPRNLRQIKNLQYKERQKSRLTHDAIIQLS